MKLEITVKPSKLYPRFDWKKSSKVFKDKRRLSRTTTKVEVCRTKY